MNDDDFWGEDFAIDYSGGTDQLFNFDIDPSTLGGIFLNQGDAENQPGGFYGNTDTAFYNPFTNLTTLYNPDGSYRGFVTHEEAAQDIANLAAGRPTGVYASTDAEAQEGGFYGNTPNATYDPKTNKTTIKDNAGNVIRTIDHNTTGIGKSLTDLLKDPRLLSLLGGIAGVATRQKGGMPKIGYQGKMRNVKAIRGEARSPTEGGRRPGGEGIGSLTGGIRYEVQPDAATAPVSQNPLDQVQPQVTLATGGRAARFLAGGTDGMADQIQTSIDGKQPARLSHGEFVIPADVVSHLGNGNSDAGAKVLYDMMAKVRKARTGNPKQGKQIDPRKFTKV